MIVYDGAGDNVAVQVGVRCGHPFVYSTTFDYVNSDGSTTDNLPPVSSFSCSGAFDKLVASVKHFAEDHGH